MNSPWTRRFLLAAVVVALVLFGVRCAFPGDAIDDGEGILGTYSVNGEDPLGTEYSGTVVIAEADGADRYAVQWLVTGTIQEGVGILSGDTFTVEWRTVTSPRGETSTGTARYVVDGEGVLRGTRTIDGVDEVGTEEIFPEP